MALINLNPRKSVRNPFEVFGLQTRTNGFWVAFENSDEGGFDVFRFPNRPTYERAAEGTLDAAHYFEEAPIANIRDPKDLAEYAFEVR